MTDANSEQDIVEIEQLSSQAAQAGASPADWGPGQARSILEGMLSSIDDTVFTFDKNGRITFYRPPAKPPYAPPEKLLGKKHSDVMPPHVHGLFVKALGRNQRGQVADYEYWLEVEGKTQCYAARLSPVYSEGEFAGSVAVIRDITDQKQAEELLKTSLVSSPIGIYIIEDGKFKVVNSTFRQLLGYSEEELLEKDPLDFVYPQDRRSVRRNAVKMLKGQRTLPYRFRYVTRNGESKWVMETVTSIRYEGRRAALGNFMDITVLKHAEEALSESEERFKSIYAESPIGIELLDSDGYLIGANKACLDMFGLNFRGQLKWYRCFDDPYIPDDVKENLLRGEVVRYEVRFDFEEARKRRLFKTTRSEVAHLDVVINPLGLEQKGSFSGYLVQIQDITERKLAEERRRELEQQAFFASRLASVGMMASGIAHEINNPLTGVIGFSQLLMEKEVPDEIRGDVEIIYEAAQRVASIVRRLLTFARQKKPERRYVSINDIITTTLALRMYEMETSNIKVNTRLDPDLPGTIADSSQLQQVFLNIVINAETEMKLAHGKGNLSITTEMQDSTIRICFKDDGPGIPKENLETIFEPFFTTRDVGEGTGLGLSICHGIITEHDGRISCESKLGKGAAFIVELPIVTEPEQLKLPEPDAHRSEATAGARILVVDDEWSILRFLSRVLGEQGHEVETVDNAEEALDRINSKTYSLILLDIKLPDMSGTELYKRIRKLDQSLVRRVIFITGDVMGADTREFFAKTKALHIAKPFDTVQLKKDINEVLAQVSVGVHALGR